MSPLTVRLAGIALAGLIGFVPEAHAGNVEVHTFDNAHQPMTDVAIAFYPDTPAPFDHAVTPEAVVAQQGMEFVPFLTVIRTGTRVSFPNRDNMEHHLKSFSDTKSFEFKIYSSGSPPPVVFDKAGPVALYCLIHDWMRGFIYVVDTPYFGATDANGNLSLANLPDGHYEVRAWHPNMSTYLPPLVQQVTLTGGEAQLRFEFPFKAFKRRAHHPMG